MLLEVELRENSLVGLELGGESGNEANHGRARVEDLSCIELWSQVDWSLFTSSHPTPSSEPCLHHSTKKVVRYASSQAETDPSLTLVAGSGAGAGVSSLDITVLRRLHLRETLRVARDGRAAIGETERTAIATERGGWQGGRD